MDWTYACPHCNAMLNPGDVIMLVGSQGQTRWLVGLHPQPGNYEVRIPPGTTVQDGIPWDFVCPVCHGDLTVPGSDRFAALAVFDGAHRCQVLFSRIAGEEATFIVSELRIEAQHGTDAPKYAEQVERLRSVRF